MEMIPFTSTSASIFFSLQTLNASAPANHLCKHDEDNPEAEAPSQRFAWRSTLKVSMPALNSSSLWKQLWFQTCDDCLRCEKSLDEKRVCSTLHLATVCVCLWAVKPRLQQTSRMTNIINSWLAGEYFPRKQTFGALFKHGFRTERLSPDEMYICISWFAEWRTVVRLKSKRMSEKTNDRGTAIELHLKGLFWDQCLWKSTQ